MQGQVAGRLNHPRGQNRKRKLFTVKRLLCADPLKVHGSVVAGHMRPSDHQTRAASRQARCYLRDLCCSSSAVQPCSAVLIAAAHVVPFDLPDPEDGLNRRPAASVTPMPVSRSREDAQAPRRVVELEHKEIQYFYVDEDSLHCMGPETFEEASFPASLLADGVFASASGGGK
ncbi:hypothetical protein BDK51DRAFT_48185 [Blyttiomyces helicus]|uniref:Uncharacterized protein n=1 Tax=Blyttiomyces helicus TaxID=388810 RepID=A0A4P9W1N4_9FUNG|nr:hypothetical protein BDK51DRAFT_48185 [Blyttiomyces helicus]|eukprot:RKO85265.1 hypothetical protein BDK51DRAFT_48185 [Blyttiomyces helicus]